MIKTRNILRKIVNAGAAEICLYLCSYLPDITRHKSINVSKRIKTLEVSETFDPLWSLWEEHNTWVKVLQWFAGFRIYQILLCQFCLSGYFRKVWVTDQIYSFILQFCDVPFSFMEYVYTYHPLNSIMQPIGGGVALRCGIENRERLWSTYMNMAVLLTKLKISSSQSSFLKLSCLHVSELFRISFPFHYNS